MGLLVQKWKIDFEDGNCGGHHLVPIGTILAIFYLQVAPMLPTKFQVNWPFGSGEEVKNRFSRFPIRTILAIFDLQVTLIIPTKFQVSWPFHGGHLGFLIGTILAIFWSTSQPYASYQLAFQFRRKKQKIDFQDGHHGCHLRFPIRTILAIFWFTNHPDASYQVSSQLAQGCRRSRLLKQLLTLHNGQRTMDDGYWLTTIAHLEHFMLRWANKYSGTFYREIFFILSWKGILCVLIRIISSRQL